MVLDASAALRLTHPDWSEPLAQAERAVGAGRLRLVAPELMWSELTSILHLMVAQGSIPDAVARRRLVRLDRAILPVSPPRLRERAWEIASRFGWGRTYDAEYCALAEIMQATLATMDRRLVRGSAGRLDYVGPLEEVVARW